MLTKTNYRGQIRLDIAFCPQTDSYNRDLSCLYAHVRSIHHLSILCLITLSPLLSLGLGLAHSTIFFLHLSSLKLVHFVW